MKLNRVFIGVLALLTFGLVSCIKNEVKELGDAGSTFVKVLEAPENKLFFEPFTGTRNVSLASIRRDANSNGSLQQSVTINLRVDTAAIRTYNTANSESFELLPDSLYTIVGTGISKTGPLTYSVTFAPGEFAKEFEIALNGSKWNLSRKYAFPIVITDPGGLKVAPDLAKSITLISVKNRWDGIYEFTAFYNFPADRPSDWTKQFTYGYDTRLITTGPTTVSFFNDAFGGSFLPLQTAGGPSGFGGTALNIEFAPDNKVVRVWNASPDSRNRQFNLRAGGNSYYDPGTKTVYLQIEMTQNGFAPIPMDITMKYKKSR